MTPPTPRPSASAPGVAHHRSSGADAQMKESEMDEVFDVLPDRAMAACELAKTIDSTKDGSSKAQLRRLLRSLVDLTMPEEEKKEGKVLNPVKSECPTS